MSRYCVMDANKTGYTVARSAGVTPLTRVACCNQTKKYVFHSHDSILKTLAIHAAVMSRGLPVFAPVISFCLKKCCLTIARASAAIVGASPARWLRRRRQLVRRGTACDEVVESPYRPVGIPDTRTPGASGRWRIAFINMKLGELA